MKLSIITPYYNTLEQIKRLAQVLTPQLDSEVEWLIIDDGCNETELDNFNAKVIHLEENSGGASVPRNVGLDNAIGEYIAFIDSDDLVRFNYISSIKSKMQEEWDYCYISWQTNTGNQIIIKNNPPSWNCCVWNCIYKRSLIGDNRFDPKLRRAEDYVFNKNVRKGTRANLKKILYIYNTDTPNSLSKVGDLFNSKYQ